MDEKNFIRLVRKRTFISFLFFAGYVVVIICIYFIITGGPKDNKAYKPFRKVMDMNASVFSTDYSEPALDKEYPKALAVKHVRVNGDIGMKSKLDTAEWILKVVRFSDRMPIAGDTVFITINELKQLPKTEVVFNFKCIEGWSQVTWWGGVRFSDLLGKFKLGTRNSSAPDKFQQRNLIAKYCGLITPDKEYFVGIYMASMLHPQTILCYEMNGAPLPMNQGAPLRLIIPVKYGIKHIKRVDTIYFSDEKPPDYWALRGYDYYAGL